MYLLLLVLPSIFVYIAPITLFCALYFVYHKMAHDNELVILENAGLSRYQLGMPALKFTIFITLLCYSITIFVTPYFKRQIQYNQDIIRESYISSMLEEKVFNSMSKDLVIYIDSQNKDGILNHVLVYDQRNEIPAIIAAQTARIATTPTSLLLELHNGTRQSLNMHGQLEQLVFDALTINFEYRMINTLPTIYSAEEMYLHELFKTSYHNSEDKVARYELNQRLSWPLMNIALGTAVLLCVLSMHYNRQLRKQNLTYTALIGVAIIMLDFFFMKGAGESWLYAIALYLYLIATPALSLYLLKQKEIC